MGCEQSYVHTDVEELHGGRRKRGGRSWDSAADMDGEKASQCVGGAGQIGAEREGGAWHGLGAGKVLGVARRKSGGGSAQAWKASMPS